MIRPIEFIDLEALADWYPFVKNEYREFQKFLLSRSTLEEVQSVGMKEIQVQVQIVERILCEALQTAQLLFSFDDLAKKNDPIWQNMSPYVQSYIAATKTLSEDHSQIDDNRSNIKRSQNLIFKIFANILEFIRKQNLEQIILSNNNLPTNEKLFLETFEMFKNQVLAKYNEQHTKFIVNKTYFDHLRSLNGEYIKNIHEMLDVHTNLLRKCRHEMVQGTGDFVEEQDVQMEKKNLNRIWIDTEKRRIFSKIAKIRKTTNEEIEIHKQLADKAEDSYKNLLSENISEWKSLKEATYRLRANLLGWIEKNDKDAIAHYNELEQLRAILKEKAAIRDQLDQKLFKLDYDFEAIKIALNKIRTQFENKILNKNVIRIQKWWKVVFKGTRKVQLQDGGQHKNMADKLPNNGKTIKDDKNNDQNSVKHQRSKKHKKITKKTIISKKIEKNKSTKLKTKSK